MAVGAGRRRTDDRVRRHPRLSGYPEFDGRLAYRWSVSGMGPSRPDRPRGRPPGLGSNRCANTRQRRAGAAPAETMAGLIGTHQVNVVRIAAPGNGQAELDAGHRLVPIVVGALPTLPEASQLQVGEAKADDITAARQQQDPGNATSGIT